MNEKELRQIGIIRKRCTELDKIMIGKTEDIEKVMKLTIAPSVPPTLRVHMINSFSDTKVLLAAFDESEMTRTKLLTEIQRLTAELAKQKTANNTKAAVQETNEDQCAKCGCSMCPSPCDDCLGCEHHTQPEFAVIVTWMDGQTEEYEVDAMELDTEINSLVLSTVDSDLIIPMDKVRHYALTGI